MLLRTISRSILRKMRPEVSMASVRHHNFDSDSQASATSVTMLSQADEDLTYIEAYSPLGFRLGNQMRILGPCALFPRSVLHWNVKGSEDICPESLSIFTALVPKIDILIVGIGDTGAKYDSDIIKYLRSHKINVEILPTDRACSTFNFLNNERRYVAAAVIPPSYIQIESDEDALIRAQLEHRNLYEIDLDYHELPDQPGEFDEELKILQEKNFPALSKKITDGGKEKKK